MPTTVFPKGVKPVKPAIVAKGLNVEQARFMAQRLSAATGLSFALIRSSRDENAWAVKLTQNHPDYRLRRWCGVLGATLLKVWRVVRK